MSIIKTCQMSIFGNYESIVPESGLVLRLTEALKEYEFIPGTIDVGLFDSDKGKASIGKRICMVSDDECWKINILMERIDFTYFYKETGKEYSHINSVNDAAVKLSHCVFPVLEEVRGKRLALNCKVLHDLTDSCIQKIIPEDIFGIGHYKKNVQRQLVNLANTAVFEFGDGKKEESNVVFKVDIDARENKKRLITTCDINTLSENGQPRFIPEDMNTYAVTVREKIQEMLLDFQAFMEK